MKLKLARTLGLATATAMAAATVSATSATAATSAPDHQTVVGHVYEATNAAGDNAVQVFDRYADGHLVAKGTVATGGQGNGASLHSQGGLVRDGNLLLVVNAGDNTVSSLAITNHGLRVRSVVPSGGTLPASVTAHDGIAYVLNQGSSSITGFTVNGGKLGVLAGSTRALRTTGGTADAAQISFQPNGDRLIVTERANNAIEVFPVHHGYAGPATSTPSAGSTPYGFDFDFHGQVLVSEAAGSASSYRLGQSLHVISPAVSDTQAAPCWLVSTPNGRWAFVVNAGSASVSSYRVAANGSLSLADATAASTGAGTGPTDATIAPNGRTLSVRLGSGAVASYAIAADGSLTSAGTSSGVAAIGSSGLAAD